MIISLRLFFVCCILSGNLAFANPYFDETKVPIDQQRKTDALEKRLNAALRYQGSKISSYLGGSDSRDLLRVRVFGNQLELRREKSGTPAYQRRSTQPNQLGSYRGVLSNLGSGEPVFYDSIGTGKEYRLLVDSLSFRFPFPDQKMLFELTAENPISGKLEKVLAQIIDPTNVLEYKDTAQMLEELEIVELKKSLFPDRSLALNIYAEGYGIHRKEYFFKRASQVVSVLEESHFPGIDFFNIRAIFSPSVKELGRAEDLGLPVVERDSFLGLFYPYWDNFGRWWHIVYPTSEERYRRAIGLIPYDYALTLIDSNVYWGVGNFRELTAIPANSSYFSYMLLHEIGHFFGLNEEYEGGGRTELEFAPGIDEPWSQNITFLRSQNYSDLKWKDFVTPNTPLPTPFQLWLPSPPKYGAYQGGYADSAPFGKSHKPGLKCVMERFDNYCDICRAAIAKVIQFDQGK